MATEVLNLKQDVIDYQKKNAGHKTAEKVKEGLLEDIRLAVMHCQHLRTPEPDKPAIDISFGDYARQRWGFETNEKGEAIGLLELLGLDYRETTIQKLYSLGEINEGYRWLVPEAIRSAIIAGKKHAIWKDYVAAEETFSQMSIVVPHINESYAPVEVVGETESIALGSLTFGQRTVQAKEYKTGLTITDRVRDFVPLSLLSIYLQHVNRKMDRIKNKELIRVLVSGDQADGSLAAPIIGLYTSGTLQYKDLVRVWVRMGRLDKLPDNILAGEASVLELLELTEYKNRQQGTPTLNLNFRTPMPKDANVDVDGNVNTNHLIVVDKETAVVKLNVIPLRLETERIANKGLTNTYVSETGGFANMFRDGRVILAKNLAYSGNAFPSWMDVDTYEQN